MSVATPVELLRSWLGPLGRYRPGLLRKDMAEGFRNCDALATPRWARFRRSMSAEERLLLQLNLRRKVAYDIGAHTGAYALFFSRRVGAGGRVIAFEPQPDNFATLTRNLEANAIRNVLPLRLALGNQRGRRTIFMLPGMPTTASLADDARTPLRRQAGETQVERLDELVAAAALPCPDFIKIDVEGMELDVLCGAEQTLARSRPQILVEIHGCGRRQKAERMRAVATLLLGLGYQLCHVESGRAITGHPGRLAAGHVFASAGSR
ncbi:MAG: FkbM family methyltransferase [Terriglobales bacterium]